MFTESLAYEVKNWGVKVSLIAPAGFKTGDQNKPMSQSDLAAMLASVFLYRRHKYLSKTTQNP